MVAIIESGGKQYKVKNGDVIRVEKLDAADGANITLDRVLVIVDGANVRVGKPYLPRATVTASVLGQGKEKKVIIYKFKSKKGFHKKRGHRQPFTALKIQSINPA